MSSTHSEPLADGHYIIIQHCEKCDVYLGVNYPSSLCSDCRKDKNANSQEKHSS